MADRFWVGGTGNINDTARWAATSGGAGGQSVPTSADNAFFDGLSDRLTVQSVTSITRVGTTATVTCNTHGYSNGHTVTIAGANEADYNGTFTISNVATNTFDYTVANAPATPATGTITVARRAAFTVTINATFNCRDFIVGNGIAATALSQVMTLAGNQQLFIYGSLFFPATNLTRTYNGVVNFSATTTGHTITLNGMQLTTVGTTFNGVGGEWTLGSAGTFNGTNQNLTIVAGTLNTANYNMTFGSFVRDFNYSVPFVFNAGSSVLTAAHSFAAWTVSTGTTNFTFNAGTSTINLTNNNQFNSIFGNGYTYYNVNITMGDAVFFGSNTFNDVTLTTVVSTSGNTSIGDCTFNNLTIGPRTTNGLTTLTVTGNSTVTGTLSINSSNTNPLRRTAILSNTISTPRTITAAAIAIGDGVDFRDITGAGAAAPWAVSTKSVGNLNGNSGITFPAPKTVYWNLAGSQLWYATAWATTATGTPAAANFPLAQDTAVITEVGAAGTISFDSLPYAISTITFDDGISPRLSAVVFNFGSDTYLYGDIKLSSGVTVTGAGTAFFVGRKVQNITGAGRTFPNPLALDSTGGSLVLQDNVTIDAARAFALIRGTLDLNNFILEAGRLSSSYATVRSIAFGVTGKVRISGNNTSVVDFQVATSFTFTGTSDVELTYAGSTGTRLIQFGWVGGSASEATALNFRVTAGFDKVIIYKTANNNFIRNLIFNDAFSGSWGDFTANGSNSGSSGILYGNLRLSPNMSIDLGSAVLFSSATSTQQLTSSGKTIPVGVTKSGAGTLQLQDSLVLASGQTFTHTAGTVSLNGRSITTPVYDISNSNVRSLIFGSGEIILNGTGTVWDASTSTSLTMSPGTGKISIVNTSATGKTFAGGNILAYPELVIAGDASTSTVTLTGANRFTKLTNARTVAYTVVFPNAQTIVNAWALNGTDGNLVTLSRTGGSGQFTITSGTGGILIAQFVSISNSIFSPGGNGYAVRSTDGGGNTGWVFGPPAFGKFLMFFTP